MPSRVHAKMLMSQLERAESVVKDLFLEATDDGIEALEAVLNRSNVGGQRIQYTVAGGNDTTTWQVNIRGNPVHLVLP